MALPNIKNKAKPKRPYRRKCILLPPSLGLPGTFVCDELF